MAQVKTNLIHEFGKSRVWAGGELKFDEQGVSQEIDGNDAISLVNASGSLSLVGDVEEIEESVDDQNENDENTEETIEEGSGEDSTGDDENEENEEEVNEDDEEEENEEGEGDQSISDEDLEAMSMGQLRDVLREAGVPKEEYDQFKGSDAKDDLIAFVKTKI